MTIYSKAADDLCWATLDTVSDHVAVLDSSGTIVKVNRAWDMFSKENEGLSSRTGVGVNYLAVCEQSARQGVAEARQVLEMIKSVLRERGSSRQIEYPCHSPHENRWFAVQAVQMEHGGRPFASVVHRNVTTRTQLSRRLSGLDHELRETRRKEAIGEWGTFLAHELKNPLVAISLRSQMLRRMLTARDGGQTGFVQYCNVIKEMTERLLSTINSATSSLIVEPGRVEPLDLAELLEDLVVISKGWATATGTRVELELGGESLVIRAHRMRVGVILLGVLKYYLDSGAQKVRVAAERRGDEVLISFDGGIAAANPLSDVDLRISEKLVAREEGTLRKEKRETLDKIVISIPRSLIDEPVPLAA